MLLAPDGYAALTHFVRFYGWFLSLNSDPWQDLEKDYGKKGYKRIVALKEQYPHLKVTIAIGGWNEGSPKYSKMASDPESRQTFIKSVMVFLE